MIIVEKDLFLVIVLTEIPEFSEKADSRGSENDRFNLHHTSNMKRSLYFQSRVN